MTSTPSSASTWTIISAPDIDRPASGWRYSPAVSWICLTAADFSRTRRSRVATARDVVYALQKNPRYALKCLPNQPVAVMRHIVAILLQNEAGALSRVANLFSTRGYNIESLAVAPTDEPTVSRLTLVT